MKNYTREGEQLIYIWDTKFRDVIDVGKPLNNLEFMVVIESILDQECIVYADGRYEAYPVGIGPVHTLSQKKLPPPSII